MPDPKLKEAMSAIQLILRQYDIAGSVGLVSRSHAQYTYQLPTWSVFQLEHGPNGEESLHIQPHNDPQVQDPMIFEKSLHCLYQMRGMARCAMEIFTHLAEQSEILCGIKVTPPPLETLESHHMAVQEIETQRENEPAPYPVITPRETLGFFWRWLRKGNE